MKNKREYEIMKNSILKYIKKVFPKCDIIPVVDNIDLGVYEWQLMVNDYPMVILEFLEDRLEMDIHGNFSIHYGDPKFTPEYIVKVLHKYWADFDKDHEENIRDMTTKKQMPWLFKKIMKECSATKKGIIPKKVKSPW